MKKSKTLYMVLAALFTALMAVFAQIQIPTPFFPITLQTFAIAVCGYTLGVKYSMLSVLSYMLLGAIGAPVFSGFCGGFHHFTDPQGGFLIAFPILTLFCALSVKRKKAIRKIAFSIIGVAVMYVFGIGYFMLVTNIKNFSIIVLVFLGVFLKDILLCIAAFYFSKLIKKRVLKSGT